MTNVNQSGWMQTLKNAHQKFEMINPEKAKVELGFAMQLFQSNASLQKCEPQSILNAVVNVARTSITLNPVMKLAYLIPRKNKCVLEFSYMGLVAMLRDNNCIKSISAHIVYEDEEFDYDIALNTIKHRPKFAKTEQEHKSRQKVGCYSVAKLPNNEIVYEFMPMWEIDKVKRMSEGSSHKFSAWNTWEDEMIKKSVIKRHFKLLISGNPTEALQTALSIENENNQLTHSYQNKSSKPSLMNAFEDVEPQNELSENNNSSFPQIDFTIEDNDVEEEVGKTEPFDTSKSDGEMEGRVDDNKAENELSEEQIEQELDNVAQSVGKDNQQGEMNFSADDEDGWENPKESNDKSK
jgi:recombination protein RecT